MRKQVSFKNITQKAITAEDADMLVNETDLGNYLKLLKKFAKKYCVAVAASDTPWGSKFTAEQTALMKEIGFKTDLFKKMRCPYAAVIDSGKLVFEKLETDPCKVIDAKAALDGGGEIRLFSSSHNVQRGDRALIQINDICCPLTERGLIFAVYDKSTKTLLDVVHSDVYHNPVCKHLLKLYQTVKSCIESHPGVLPVGYTMPGFFKTPYTAYEKMVLKNRLHFSVISANADKQISILSQYYDADGIREVLATPKSYYDHRNVRQYEDIRGRYVNIEGGHRVTKYQPDTAPAYIYIYSAIAECSVWGTRTSTR